MKKKLKDLTDEEMNEICRNQRPQCTCENDRLITCPLWNGKCMKGFIQRLRFVNREVDLCWQRLSRVFRNDKGEERMTSLEYVKSQIAKLKDDLQHYTMVEKDSALASQIRYDLEQFETIESELKAKANLVSMCENLAKLVGLKEKDYVELETLITKKLTALDAIKRNPILIISLLTNNATYKHVVDVTNESERPTQEEWDLLKEVLL